MNMTLHIEPHRGGNNILKNREGPSYRAQVALSVQLPTRSKVSIPYHSIPRLMLFEGYYQKQKQATRGSESKISLTPLVLLFTYFSL